MWNRRSQMDRMTLRCEGVFSKNSGIREDRRTRRKMQKMLWFPTRICRQGRERTWDSIFYHNARDFPPQRSWLSLPNRRNTRKSFWGYVSPDSLSKTVLIWTVCRLHRKTWHLSSILLWMCFLRMISSSLMREGAYIEYGSRHVSLHPIFFVWMYDCCVYLFQESKLWVRRRKLFLYHCDYFLLS